MQSMPAGNASGWRHAAVFGVSALLCLGGVARADDADAWRDIETKYFFGFTTGSGIGIEGEKEFTTDTIGRFGKRDGRYNATETSTSTNSPRPNSFKSNLALSDRPTTSGM
jgi:hypothetical protein